MIRAGAVLAHGVGGRQDLPIPLSFALTGAIVALLVSFIALGALWRTPRLGVDGLANARPLPGPVQRIAGSAAWPWVWRVVGLLLAAYFLLALLAGPDTDTNPAAGAVYVLFWVGLVPLSLLLGPVWRGLNPLRTLHLLACRAVRRDPRRGRWPMPAGLGYWPAAVGLFAFVWLELVAPDRATLPVLRLWLAGYAIFVMAGAIAFGSGWFARGDAFEAYSSVLGRLAPIARRRDGVLVWRNPLDGMARLRGAPALTVFVVVLLGSTMYDSLSNAPVWVRFVQESGLPAPLVGTAGLVAVIGIVLAAYLAATGMAGWLGGVRGVGPALAHAVVPIAAGYLVAHYFTLLVLEGQRTVALWADPMGIGANWLGTGTWAVQSLGMSPPGIAALQVTVIVIGHILGTVLAHDRALALLPRATVLAGQIPLLVLMVVYTVLGLLLLFAA